MAAAAVDVEADGPEIATEVDVAEAATTVAVEDGEEELLLLLVRLPRLRLLRLLPRPPWCRSSPRMAVRPR